MTKNADVYLLCDPWLIIEDGWHQEKNMVSESIFSLGNEFMGVRGYAEESVGAETLRGSYFNGIYEEIDLAKSYKGIITKMHFMVNAVDWLHTEIKAVSKDGKIETLDMSACEIKNFRRTLDMMQGALLRSFDWHTKSGPVIHLEFTRFLGMEDEGLPVNAGLGFQKISFNVSGGDISINLVIANSFNTEHGWNKANYWDLVQREWFGNGAALQASVKRTKQQIFSGFTWKASENVEWSKYEGEKSAGFSLTLSLTEGKNAWIKKTIFNYAVKEKNADTSEVRKKCITVLENGLPEFDNAFERQKKYWNAFWKNADIIIDGDMSNQQGIRFCIFQMHQTYHGRDPSNNIGAKGLTGEAYNGHTFWDTETYCLPFYLFSNPQAARNLLEYRYVTLNAAKERARQLDCRGACYPVATLNGDECCGLWQHASLQFQASTAVAYGISHYMKLTSDTEFLYGHGVEILLEISRFLESRGSWNSDETGFGFYAVMGPDEFHMMVNHNCYTNFMAKKTFEFTEKTLSDMEKSAPREYEALCAKTGLSESERKTFAKCAEKMIILYNEETKIYEQHDGYLTLPRIEISKIPVTNFPLYNNWSYDRIYRTDMIKQPDVLMFMFLHNREFSNDVKRRNYEFYEPKTIHESSLSPSIHSIFASELQKPDDAFRFFAFATRMDLDNYNRNSAEGLHTTSIAAAWMNIIYGFGGFRSDGDEISLNPCLPNQWKKYEFNFLYRNVNIHVEVNENEIVLSTQDKLNETLNETIPLIIYGKRHLLDSKGIRLKINEAL